MAILALEDGKFFHGESIGAPGEVCAEVVFNTSLTGYQEILTDASYRGQMIAMTASHIGNVGINPDDNESPRIQAAALIAREIESVPSNWRATKSLPDWLREQNIIAIDQIDTRALTRHLRERGVMKGIISTIDQRADTLVDKARAWQGLDGRDLVREVSCQARYSWNESSIEQFAPPSKPTERTKQLHVIVYDFGVKWNILRRLTNLGCRVTVVPATTSAEECIALTPNAVLLSNGPGDPSALPYAVTTIRCLIDRQLPMFGVCLGHQLLGIALGGRTFKLRFGHHGGNHPVQHLTSGKIAITAQNHNYAVDADSLDLNRVEITHRSLNDDCVEGLRLKGAPVFSVQYHPESSPGPHDSDDLFGQFIQSI